MRTVSPPPPPLRRTTPMRGALRCRAAAVERQENISCSLLEDSVGDPVPPSGTRPYGFVANREEDPDALVLDLRASDFLGLAAAQALGSAKDTQPRVWKNRVPGRPNALLPPDAIIS